MRNIALSDFKSRRLENIDDCEAFCHGGQFLYACAKGKIIRSQADSIEVISNFRENLYPVSEEDVPKALEISYCCEKDLLYIILFNGDIISLQINEFGSENIVGSVDSGIKAAQWSPNEEVVALVTGNDTVIVMTQDFDPVSETNLHGGGFGEKQFITVGWGKKETQFRGSEGKFSASGNKQKEELRTSHENIDSVTISWRGDGEYFAVSSINPASQRRYLRIFNKIGVLQYTSEDINGLEHTLSWSSGSLIASTQILPNKYVVCFFEKNGLKHGEFKIPPSSKEIKIDNVLWNKDSKILALLITKILDGTKYIQLYTASNYNWYCKYTINFDSVFLPILIQWDNHKSNTLNVIVKKGNSVYFNEYSWLWVINKSKGSDLKDESLVAVINGSYLKLTSFKRGIIPPPMCSCQIYLPENINSVCFAPDAEGVISSNDLIVQLSNGNLLFYRFVHKNNQNIEYEFISEIKNCCEFEILMNVSWVDTYTILLGTVKMGEKKSKPYASVFSIEKFERPAAKFLREDIPLESTVSLIKACKSVVLIYTNDLKLYSYFNNELILLCACNKSLIDLEVKQKENGGFNYFSLDVLNKFCVNNNVVLNNVLSFHVHENFILLTTMKHELLCLNAEIETRDTLDLPQISSRKVERGSRIITSVHNDSKVIFQLPRGNLECVQPRALSLFVLGKYLDSLNYFDAFDLMRKQRINLNLLYDHSPDLFSKNVNIFFEQIRDLQWISLFISDLSHEDVTQTMYSVFYKTKNINPVVNKIDTVCDLVEKFLTEKENSDEYLLPILTSFIKRGKTEYLESTLLKLKQLREKEQAGIKPPVSFDEALKYVMYIIDVEELYNVALGMYDFDLVLLIASKSQKDPKEYLEFLNELNQLEPNYQRYRIDKYLKRFKKALTNLVKCEGDDIFNECINFIKANNLYKHALKLIPENTDWYKNICVCYGDELLKSHSYEEAGFMYLNAGIFKAAMEAYRKAGNWQEVLFCARELKLSESELEELYLDLALELDEAKLFKESATVYLDYLRNVEECIRTLCRGKLFSEAYRISHLNHRPDLISQIILPEVLEQGNLMELHISNLSDTFVRQRNRLEIVRNQKLEASKEKNEFDDLYIETNSIITKSNATSRNSNRSYRSAKNRRKHERKLLSLKEGSPYEDLALVTSLHNIVTNAINLKSEIKELNKYLLKINQYDTAEMLQKKLEDFFKVIEKSKSEIWTPDLVNSRQFYGSDSTSNEISAMYMRSESLTPVPLNPKYAFPPDIQNNIKWKLEILNS